MINTGYAMTCAGALFGLTFLVIGGWLLVGMVRRAGRHYPEPEDPTLDNERVRRAMSKYIYLKYLSNHDLLKTLH